MLITNTINDALVEIGVINPINEATPEDHEYGLRTLNRIIDSYNTQNLLITYLEDITYEMPTVNNECETTDPDDLVARAWTSVIEIGHCKQINSQAPVDIQGLFWRQGGADYDSIAMTFNEWKAIGWKEASTIPSRHYVQRADGNNIKIHFDRLPLDGLELHLMAKMPYTGKNSIGNEYLPTDDIQWNFGFEKTLMLRLAVELCSSYGIEPAPSLTGRAMEAENYLKAHNYQPRTLRTGVGFGRKGRRSWSKTNRARY